MGLQSRLMDLQTRFWWSVILSENPWECWGWRGLTYENGYGRINYKDLSFYAHRFSWSLHKGKPIPKGFQILHSCDDPPCCNFIHLFKGTNQDNVDDKIKKSRQGIGNTKYFQDVVDEIMASKRGGKITNTSIGLRLGISDRQVARIYKKGLTS